MFAYRIDYLPNSIGSNSCFGYSLKMLTSLTYFENPIEYGKEDLNKRENN
jgi:hypothetical protein